MIFALFTIIHEKTNHTAHKMIFELRPPLATMAFGLLLEKIEVSSQCDHGDMSQNVPGLPVLHRMQ